MRKSILLTTLTLSLLSLSADAVSAKTFDEIMKPYEEIRLILLADSVEGIDERAATIGKTAAEAAQASSTAQDVRPLLAKISAFSEELAEGREIETKREAFYEISKMMVQYRAKVDGDDLPVVMYCPMAKKSWLQLEEKIGNPYHGQSMPNCGGAVRSR